MEHFINKLLFFCHNVNLMLIEVGQLEQRIGISSVMIKIVKSYDQGQMIEMSIIS